MSFHMQKPKSDISLQDILAVYDAPFHDLIYRAHTVHREHHQHNALHVAQLLSIKTGACPEDCGYCSQSGHYKTHVEKEKLLSLQCVLEEAKAAKEGGATRFCMGAAWRSPPESALAQIKEMIQGVKALGLETCMTLGMLDEAQAKALHEAGLDYYNHNIDTSPSYYEKVITTRTFKDRLDTIQNVRDAGISVCCGGILGLGETKEDRIEFISVLANMETPPESIPINRLITVKGTPLENAEPIENFEFVRTIATVRIFAPKSVIRLSAGRVSMSDELQALCFFAGANSVWRGERLLTEENPRLEKDKVLFNKLGLESVVDA